MGAPCAGSCGFDNYRNVFRKRVDSAKSAGSDKKNTPKGQSIKEFIAELDREGTEVSVLGRVDNYMLADVVAGYPNRFFALASISLFDGMRGVREFEHLIKQRKLNGLRVAALCNNLAASDRRYSPLYAKCVELDVPVRIYSTMNHANDRPTISAIPASSTRSRWTSRAAHRRGAERLAMGQ